MPRRRTAPTPLLDRDLPSDLEAERRLIGAALAHPHVVPEITALVPPEAFLHEAHQHAWRAVHAVWDARGTVDSLTVSDALRASDALEAAGGVAYLDSLADVVVTDAHAHEHARIVLGHWRRRRLIETAYRAMEGAYDLDEPGAIAEELVTGVSLVDTGERDEVCLADVRPEPLHWLWPGRLPVGMVTVLDGDPGLGKSLLTLDLAARITTGRPMPDDTRSDVRGPAGVVLLGAEDDLARTIRPRLEAAGADLRRVVVLRGRSGRWVTVADLGLIRSAIERHQAALLVVDPLMAHLPDSVSAYRDQDVRSALGPLGLVASETGCTVVLVRHLTKDQSKSALYRGGGSAGGIIGIARAGLMVTHHPDDEGARVLAATKSSLAARPPALQYRIEPVGQVARIRWEGVVEHTADELLQVATEDSDERNALVEAVRVLHGLLADGPRSSRDVEREIKNAGVTEITMRRARARLRIQAVRDASHWVLRLPD